MFKTVLCGMSRRLECWRRYWNVEDDNIMWNGHCINISSTSSVRRYLNVEDGIMWNVTDQWWTLKIILDPIIIHKTTYLTLRRSSFYESHYRARWRRMTKKLLKMLRRSSFYKSLYRAAEDGDFDYHFIQFTYLWECVMKRIHLL